MSLETVTLPCLFIWDNQTTVDTGPAQAPSIYANPLFERTNLPGSSEHTWPPFHHPLMLYEKINN